MNNQNETTKTVEQKPVSTFNAAKFINEHGGTKSGAIRALIASGKSRGEVAKLLDIRYQHVRNVMITPIKKAVDRTVVAPVVAAPVPTK